MFIKRLEIFGFKSFKNRTVMEFDTHEITGIVGPNGCGKSNVVDALLWVMGESAPKHLRGDSLSDVIFSGTSKEPPGNLVEVNLTLGRGETGFPENYKEFSELMITRRSYRDGKNEYLINEQACLLRDVRELFMNTGAGCRGFSIIEQAAIEKLITAKPIQRRFIIEEVAGITKFKNRKMESIRKLDLVNHNLQRLNDVLKSQETQLNQLTSQAKKAEKYKKLKQKIETRQKQIKSREQEELFCTYQDLKKDQESLKAQKVEKKKHNQELEGQIQSGKENIKNIEQQIEKEKENVEEVRQSEMNKKIEEAGLLDKVKAFKMIEDIKTKKIALQENEKAIQKDLAEIKDFFKDKKSVEESEKSAKQIKTQLDEIKQNKKSSEVNVASLQKQIQFVEKEIESLSEEKTNIQSQVQSNINDNNKAKALLKQQQQASSTLSDNFKSICEEEKELESKKKKIEEKVNQLNQNISVLQHKIEEMKKLISSFSSANEGANDLEQWRPEDFQSLFKNLKVPEEYSTALGAVLGHYIYALIPKEDICIESAVQRLKEQHKGRTSFLSSLPIQPVPSSSRKEIKTYPAFVCFLDEKIKLNAPIRSLQPFLEQTVVVSDLHSAFELKKQFPFFQFVTKEGDVITKDSFIYAGSSDKETNLLEIRSQIDKCSKDLSANEIELKVQAVDLESCSQKLDQVQQKKQKLQEDNVKNSEDLISLRKDVEQMEKELLRLSESRKLNDQRLAKFDKEKRNLLQHKDASDKEIENFDNSISLKESQFQELQTVVEEYKTQDLKRIQREKELLENKTSQSNLDQEISLLVSLMGRSSDSKKETEENIKQSHLSLEEEIKSIREQRQKISSSLIAFQKELEKQNQKKATQEQKIKDMEEQIYQLKIDTNNLESEWDKKELEKTYLEKKFLENYQMPIKDFVSSSEEIPLEQLKEEMEHYEKQLERIGGINFLALEDYEKLSKENFFLNEQKEDLTRSKKEIAKVISHIDKLCETRFSDMFEKINKRFSKVFPIVFQGESAKAELILHKEEDDKEHGVDILIQPPGKRPQSVSLLSRGEKALTSICLIYSLFLVKPSPFCIIDEADAPLDDANIFRFLSVLKEMSRKSQVIAVTHNKYTMQNCRKLYGVTMEQPGISQIVSVDMKDQKLTESHRSIFTD